MQKVDCSGCDDDFYNGKNNLDVGVCFRFTGCGNRVRRRFWIDYNTPTHHREAYTEVRVPGCYHRKGRHYTDSIPPYAKTPEERRKETEEKK